MTNKVIATLLILSVTGMASGPQYVLGPDDQVTIRAIEAEEFPPGSIRIASDGTISLPMIGRIQAGGRTVAQLERDIAKRLETYIRDPQVSVSIAEFRVRSVSVLGAVGRPGMLHLRGSKTLWEAISEAGGLTNAVGDTIKITRRSEYGPLPLTNAELDESGKFFVATVSVRSLRETRTPEENIELMEHDVISVSTADIVYVVGHVNRAGGFATNGAISVLEAVALSGGLAPYAKAEKAHVLRLQPGTDQREIVAVNLKKLFAGKGEDIILKPQDILFVPNAAWKEFTLRTVQSAIAAASSSVIFVGLGRR